MDDISVAASSEDEYDSDLEFPAWQDPASDSENGVANPQSVDDAEGVKAWNGPNPLGKNQYSGDPQSETLISRSQLLSLPLEQS